MKNARLVALDALLRVDFDGGYSNIVLNEAVKAERLDSRDVSLVSAIFYGVLERRLTLDYIISQFSKIRINKLSKEVHEILRIGLYQLIYMDKVPDAAVVDECVKLTKVKRQKSAGNFINGVLRAFLRADKLFQMPMDEMEYLSIKYSCSKDIVEIFINSYGKENAIKILESFLGAPLINIRVNTLKTTTEELLEKLKEEGVRAESSKILDDSIIINTTGRIDKLKSFEDGLFHVQDVASQICCKILNPKPGERVIDVCAAPGGKTFTMAEYMKNKGEILSFDQYDSKVNLIKNGADRLSIKIVSASKRDARNADKSLDLADKVLCDVPCSGLGIIGRKPEIKYKTKKDIKELPKVQYDILCKSSELVKIGGTLMFSTCTLNMVENNYIADKFLKEHMNYEKAIIDFQELGLKNNSFDGDNQLTLLPTVYGTDGFFISAFKRVR